MRCTQNMGLTEEAKLFLNGQCKIEIKENCPVCNHAIRFGKVCRVYKDASGTGMFEDGPLLKEYELVNGKKVREVIQETIWSSGPCIFLCLEGEEGFKSFTWSEEEMNRC